MSVKYQNQIALVSITIQNIGTQLVNRLDYIILPADLFANYVRSISMTEKFWRLRIPLILIIVDCVLNVIAHAQKPHFIFRRNGGVHLNRRGRQFSRLLAAEVCASAVVMLDTPCSEVL